MLEETAFQQIFGHDAKMDLASDNYYDPHLFMHPEIAKSRSVLQSTARNRLFDLLESSYTDPDWLIAPSFLFIHKTAAREIYILPQLCVFKGITV